MFQKSISLSALFKLRLHCLHILKIIPCERPVRKQFEQHRTREALLRHRHRHLVLNPLPDGTEFSDRVKCSNVRSFYKAQAQTKHKELLTTRGRLRLRSHKVIGVFHINSYSYLLPLLPFHFLMILRFGNSILI